MTTIYYQTNTGTTKRYAERLSERTGLPCLPAEKATAAGDAVFLGWVFNGEVQGLSRLLEAGVPLKAVGAVGIMEQEADKVRAACGELPFFFLPGAFDIKKQKGMYKLMSGMIVRAIRAKVKANPTPEGERVLAIFEQGVDLFREDALDALAALLCENS